MTSPFRHELPANSLFWEHPLLFLGAWWRVIKLHDRDRQIKVVERRALLTDDASKRKEYLDAHGIEPKGVVGRLVGRQGATVSKRDRTARDDLVAEEALRQAVAASKAGEGLARDGGK